MSSTTDITLVVTSCGRHDLLNRTVNSFYKKTDLYPDETIIVEDDPAFRRPPWFNEFKYPKLGNLVWLQNEPKIGQIASIDRAYAGVKTRYIFHCEDDWSFELGGFMQKSLDILEKYPEIIMVALTENFAIDDERYPFRIAKPGYGGCWNGLSFNPGLRRMSDYRRLGTYREHGLWEWQLSKVYLEMGYITADIGRHILHTGAERHIVPFEDLQ